MPPTTTTTFPPTPAPSTDIKGKESASLAPIDTSFALPPSAVSNASNDPAPPLSPAESRKTSSSHSDVSLPPPPARSRKIIQVKPKGSSEERDATYTPSAAVPRTKVKETGKRKSTAGAAGTAATRKVARKTAHSIIERRRRSKMNEEFGVLKDLIPACRGCEMHKLAILQASIEYLRYLESCVAELKAGRAASSEAPSIPALSPAQDDDDDAEEDAADDGDEQISDIEQMDVDDARDHTVHRAESRDYQRPAPGTSSTALSALSPRTTARSSTSSTAPSTLPSPSFGPVSSHASLTAYSQTTSPIFGPYYNASSSHHHRPTPSRGSTSHSYSISSQVGQPYHSYSRASSTQTSPVIFPQHQGLNEAEASSALLMLNQDRRRSSLQTDPSAARRGMSVRDLLSN